MLRHQESSDSDSLGGTMTQPKSECLRKLIERNRECQSLAYNLESAKESLAEASNHIEKLERAAEAGKISPAETVPNVSKPRAKEEKNAKGDKKMTTEEMADRFLLFGKQKDTKHIIFSLFGKNKKAEKRAEKLKSLERQTVVDDEDEPEPSAGVAGSGYIKKLSVHSDEIRESAQELRRQLVEQIGSALEAALAAKQHLVKNDLYKWKVQQKLAQIGPKEKHEAQQSELDRLDPIFEQCGDEIRKLKNMIEQTAEEVKKESNSAPELKKLQEYHQQISKLIYHFVWELLGGSSLGCRANNRAEVTCQLISEDQAKNVGKHGQRILPAGKLLHNVARFELDSSSQRFFAYYSRPMILTDLHRQARTNEPVYRQRFYFLFTVKMTGGSMVLQAPKVSLPVIVLNEPDPEMEEKADAYIFWEHAFAEEKGVLTRVPREGSEGVLWPQAARALNLKFQQLIEGRDPESQDYVVQQLSDIAMKHLAARFFGQQPNYANCRLKFEQFFQEEVSMRTDGTRCVFWEWYYAAAEIINKKLLKHWNKGLIQGFLGRNAAEELLMTQERPAMIIKFSDNTVGGLIITYYVPERHPHPFHLQLFGQDLEKVPFEEIVQETEELLEVQWIYPDKLKKSLWQPAGSSYGNRIHNPYAKRVCGPSKSSIATPVTQWADPTPPPGLRDVLGSSDRSSTLSASDEDDTVHGSLSISFGVNNQEESLSID